MPSRLSQNGLRVFRVLFFLFCLLDECGHNEGATPALELPNTHGCQPHGRRDGRTQAKRVAGVPSSRFGADLVPNRNQKRNSLRRHVSRDIHVAMEAGISSERLNFPDTLIGILGLTQDHDQTDVVSDGGAIK